MNHKQYKRKHGFNAQWKIVKTALNCWWNHKAYREYYIAGSVYTNTNWCYVCKKCTKNWRKLVARRIPV